MDQKTYKQYIFTYFNVKGDTKSKIMLEAYDDLLKRIERMHKTKRMMKIIQSPTTGVVQKDLEELKIVKDGLKQHCNSNSKFCVIEKLFSVPKNLAQIYLAEFISNRYPHYPALTSSDFFFHGKGGDLYIRDYTVNPIEIITDTPSKGLISFSNLKSLEDLVKKIHPEPTFLTPSVSSDDLEDLQNCIKKYKKTTYKTIFVFKQNN